MKLLRWFRCPICDGDGGWSESILTYADGPWWPCQWCKETGRLHIGQWLTYRWLSMIGRW